MPVVFEEFVAQQGAALLRLAFVLTGYYHAAEDLTQTALADVSRHWRRVSAARSPEAYARRCLVNAHLSSRRRRWTTERPIEVQNHHLPPAADPADAVALREALRARVAALPPRARTVAVLATVVVVAFGLSGGQAPAVTSPAPAGSVPAGHAGQPLPDTSPAQSCAFEYSPAVIASRLDFALDGVVIEVGPSVSLRPGDADPRGYAGVTLQVNEWFMGGTTRTVTVDMPSGSGESVESAGEPAGYGIGTRMLVSGAARWGGDDPLAYPVAWWGCGGFTRYYSEEVAAQWRDAMR